MFITSRLTDTASPLFRSNVVLNVWDNGHDKYDYEFSEQGITVKPGTIITISLKKNILNNGFHAHIVSYLCSAPQKAIFHDLSPKPIGHPSPSPYTPPHPFPSGSNEISFETKISDYELVFIGVVVRIVDPNNIIPPFDLICDPQVGNGPP